MADQTITLRIVVDTTKATGNVNGAKEAIRDLGSEGAKAAVSLQKGAVAVEVMGNAAERMRNAANLTARDIGVAVKVVDELVNAAGRIAGAMLTAVKNSIDYADAAGKMAERVNMSVESLSAMQHAARSNSESLEAVPRMLDAIAISSAKAAGGARQQSADFRAMGVQLRDSATGGLKPTERILEEVAEKLSNMRDGAAKTALANRLFGSSSADLTLTLKQLGEEGFDGLKRKAAEAGRLIDGETAEAAARFNDQLQRAQDQVAGVAADIGRALLPSLTRAAEEFASFLETARESETLQGLFADLWDLIGAGAEIIKGVALELYAFANDPSFLKFLRESRTELEGISSLMPESMRNIKLGAPLTVSWREPEWYRRIAYTPETLAKMAVNDGVDAASKNPFSGMETRRLVDMSRPLLADLAKMWETVTGRVDDYGLHVGKATEPLSKKEAPLPIAADKSKEFASAMEQQLSAIAALDKAAGSLTAKFDPLSKAYDDYLNRLRTNAADGAKAVEQMDKLGKSGLSLAQIQAKVVIANDAARMAYGKEVAAIVLRNEKLREAPFERLRDQLAGYLERQRDQVDQMQAEIEARGELSPLQQAELEIKKMLSGASEEYRLRLKDETDELRKNAAELQRLAAIKGISDDLSSMFNGAAGSIRNGGDVFLSLRDAAIPVLDSITRKFERLAEVTAKNADGTWDWSKAMENLGKSVEGSLPALGNLLGAVAMTAIGGKDGQIIGGALSGAVQGFVIGNWIGAAVGAVLGGVMGSMGEGNPAIYAGSGLGRHGTPAMATPLGRIATDTDNLPNDAYRKFEQQIKAFDIQLARLLTPDQLINAKAALEGWSGKFSDIESLLNSRFDAVLATLDPALANFVNEFAGDLQGRMQALADVLSLQKLIDSGNGVEGVDLSTSLGLVNEFAYAGERVVETYQRLAIATELYDRALDLAGISTEMAREEVVRFAAQIADAAGGIQQAQNLWQSYFSAFYDTNESIAAQIESLRSTVSEQLSDLSLPAEIGMDDFRKQFEEALPRLTPEEVVTWLKAANALAQLTAAQAQLEQKVAEVLGPMGLLGQGLSQFGSTLVAIKAQEATAIDASNALAKSRGAEGASAMQLAAIHQWTVRQIGAAIRQLQAETSRLIADLYGKVPGSLDLINQRIAELEGAANSTASGIDRVADAGNNLFDQWGRGIKSVQDYLDSMLLGDLSALSPEEQIAEARRQLLDLQAAAMRGDTEALAKLPQMADAFLRLQKGALASGGDYNAEFDWVRQLLGSVAGMTNPYAQPGDGNTGGGAPTVITPSPELEALYKARDDAMAAQYAEQRRALAQQLTQHLADLATMLNVPIFELIEAQGVNLKELATDLGADLQNLTGKSVEVLGNMATTLGVPLGELVQKLGLTLPDLKDGLEELTKSLGIDLKSLTTGTVNQLAALAGSLGSNLTELSKALGIDLGKLTDVDSPIFVALKENIGSMAPDVKSELEPLLDAVKNAAGDEQKNAAVKALRDHVDAMAPDVREQLRPFFDDLKPTKAIDQLGYLKELQSIAEDQLSVLGTINANLAAMNREMGVPSYAIGTGYVRGDQLANIHNGEAVVPAAVNTWFRSANWQLPRASGSDATVTALRRIEGRLESLERSNAVGQDKLARTIEAGDKQASAQRAEQVRVMRDNGTARSTTYGR